MRAAFASAGGVQRGACGAKGWKCSACGAPMGRWLTQRREAAKGGHQRLRRTDGGVAYAEARRVNVQRLRRTDEAGSRGGAKPLRVGTSACGAPVAGSWVKKAIFCSFRVQSRKAG